MKTIKILSGIALALACGLATTLQAQNLYVSNAGNDTIGEYGLDGSTNNASLISGLQNPEGIAISGNDLFVANFTYDNFNGPGIGEYTTSGATVNASLSGIVDWPEEIAISGNELFYVTVYGTISSLREYTLSGGRGNPYFLIGVGVIGGIAISGTNLFVASEYASEHTAIIGEYGLDGSTNNASLITGLSFLPRAIAISGTNLFIAILQFNSIAEYTTSGKLINASLITGLNNPSSIAISGNDLFVANANGGTIGEYTTSGTTINASLISGLDDPEGIAISPALQLNIANAGNNQVVLSYPAWATNSVLQSLTNLASTNWLAVTNGATIIGDTNIAVTVTNNLPASFFRLAPAQ